MKKIIIIRLDGVWHIEKDHDRQEPGNQFICAIMPLLSTPGHEKYLT
jgi:hypothetical protein